jgi:hypothetical protein
MQNPNEYPMPPDFNQDGGQILDRFRGRNPTQPPVTQSIPFSPPPPSISVAGGPIGPPIGGGNRLAPPPGGPISGGFGGPGPDLGAKTTLPGAPASPGFPQNIARTTTTEEPDFSSSLFSKYGDLTPKPNGRPVGVPDGGGQRPAPQPSNPALSGLKFSSQAPQPVGGSLGVNPSIMQSYRSRMNRSAARPRGRR